MPITVVCSCGKVTQAPDQYAGRRAKCKACGATFRIPDATVLDYPIQLDADDAADVGLPPPPASVTPAPSVSAPAGPSHVAPGGAVLHPTMPREPWYYSFLVQYAYLIIGLGAAQFALVVLVNLFVLFRMSDREAPLGFVFGVLTTCGISLAIFLGTILFGAPILLAVDAARNLRVLRWRG